MGRDGGVVYGEPHGAHKGRGEGYLHDIPPCLLGFNLNACYIWVSVFSKIKHGVVGAPMCTTSGYIGLPPRLQFVVRPSTLLDPPLTSALKIRQHEQDFPGLEHSHMIRTSFHLVWQWHGYATSMTTIKTCL